MDTRKRTILKALTWQGMGLFTMTAMGLIFTGSLSSSASLALSSMVLGFVCFLIHERIWNTIGWGRRSDV